MLCARRVIRSTQSHVYVGIVSSYRSSVHRPRRIATGPPPVAMSATTTRDGASTSAAPRSKSVAVIGAGAAGLIACKELTELGHRVKIFEQSSGLGGVWNYVEETEDDPVGRDPRRKRVHGSMYANLRTNLPREVMGVSDFPFTTSFPGSADHNTYCSHGEVLRYLQAYAARFDVVRNIQFSTAVESVSPSFENDGTSLSHWTVSVSPSAPSTGSPEPGTREAMTFDAVVVCNGHYSAPRVPTYEGQDGFSGVQMHSHNYRRPDNFVGKRVVVIGAAFSGSDISQELLDHGAAAVYLSGRNWEDLASRDNVEGLRQVIKVGDVRRMVAGSKSIEFVDGMVIDDVDVVMYATGYLYDFPFFDRSVIDYRVADNRVEDLYQHVFFPRFAPSLSLIGIPWKVVPFPLFELQARWVGKCLSGEVELPSEKSMVEHIKDSYDSLGDLPKRYTHRFDASSQGVYAKWLGRQCGEEDRAWPDWRRDLYIVSGQNRRANGIDFREYDLRELGAKEAYDAFQAEIRSAPKSSARN